MYESTMTRSELKQRAKEALKGKWGIAIVVTLIYMAINSALGFFPPALIVVMPPLMLGIAMMALNLLRDEQAELENLFDGFKYFGVSVVASLLAFLIILAWSLIPIGLQIALMASTFMTGQPGPILILLPVVLLASIPAMIAQLNYSQIYFVLADNPTLTATQALKKSKEMMLGHRLAYFVLMLSFIGWAFLCIFTLFIGYLWLVPYYFVSTASFYDQLKSDSPKVITDQSLEF